MLVEKYYTTFYGEPDQLYRFYKKESTALHGPEGVTFKVSEGQASIRQLIASHNFKNCKVMVSNIDFQKIGDVDILVQIIGELANNNGSSEQGEDQEEPPTSQKFVQSFVLSCYKSENSGYFIRNDVLRFLREDLPSEAGDYEDGAAAPTVVGGSETEPETVEAEAVKAESEETSVAEVPATEPVETSADEEAKEVETVAVPTESETAGPTHVEPAAAATAAPVATQTEDLVDLESEDEAVTPQATDSSAPAPDAAAAAATVPAAPVTAPSIPTGPASTIAAAAAAAATTAAAAPAEAAEATEEAKAEPAAPAPLTAKVPTSWASVASVHLSDGSPAPVATPKPAPVARRAPKPAAQHAGGARGGVVSAGNGGGSANGTTGPTFYSVYIKKTHNVSLLDLREALNKFGKVVHFQPRENERRDLFVDFETEEGMLRALKAKEMVVGGQTIAIQERQRKKNYAYGGNAAPGGTKSSAARPAYTAVNGNSGNGTGYAYSNNNNNKLVGSGAGASNGNGTNSRRGGPGSSNGNAPKKSNGGPVSRTPVKN